jgi:IS5 family transposase
MFITEPSSTKNRSKARDPEMHPTKKGERWYHGLKGHTRIDAELGITHTLGRCAPNTAEINVAHSILLDTVKVVFADASFQGSDKRVEQARRVSHHQTWPWACASAKSGATMPMDRCRRRSESSRRAYLPGRGRVSEILCVRHTMKEGSMYAKQETAENGARPCL